MTLHSDTPIPNYAAVMAVTELTDELFNFEARLIRESLRAVFQVDSVDDLLTADIELSEAEISDRMGEWLAIHERDIRLFIDRRKAHSERPLAVLRWLLGRVGMRLDGQQVMRDGSRFYVYAPDCDALRVWLSYSDTRRAAVELVPTRMKCITNKLTHKPKRGYVYLLRIPGGYWKIGRSATPNNRLKTFEVKLPFEVTYECLIPTKDMIGLEKHLHKRFADKRQNGSEFFALTDEDVEYIKALAK